MITASDAPIDLLRAISHGNKILDWHDNLISEEVPPEWMWPFDELISDWFDEIKAARNAKYSGGNVDSDDMMDNTLAEERR